MAEPTINDLLADVIKNVGVYNHYLIKSGLPQPSHGSLPSPPQGPPPPLPDAVAGALEAAKEATYELYNLLLGPVEMIMEGGTVFGKNVALSFINHFQVAQKLQPGQKKSYAELAQECNVHEEDMRRMLRLGMTEHLFLEPEPGMVAHSAASMMLLVVPNFDAWVWNMARLNFKAVSTLPDAMEKWPGSEEPDESAFTLAFGLNESYFDHLTKHPAKAERFGQSMAFITDTPIISVDHFIEAYDFSQLPKDALFVDVGGSHGIVATKVAQANPEFRCIVQDISAPALVAGREALPADLAGRVEFAIHDFWQSQPVAGADVYFFRWIFHDWSDLYAIKLLQNLIPALSKGSRVVINDICLPQINAKSLYQQRVSRGIDCIMKAFANAKERDADEWHAVFAKADARFQVRPIVQPRKAAYSIIEAIWNP